MNCPPLLSCLFFASIALLLAQCQDGATTRISLPTSKLLAIPSPGHIGFLNSFPATIAVSPDGQYAAILNDGYGTIKSQGKQSIAVLDLRTLHLKDFPDSRFSATAHQSYFLGLAFSSDGREVYASVVSLSDLIG